MVQDLTEDGTGIVWSTAYLDEAERCAEVIVLNDGKVPYEGEPRGLTDRVDGRVYQVTGVGKGRRRLLTDILNTDGIADALIQDSVIRVAAARASVRMVATLRTLAQPCGEAKVDEVAPRFEDAFIDALGGDPDGRSALAERFAPEIGDEPIAVARDLEKRYGDFTAATGMSLEITPGTIPRLLGANGAGEIDDLQDASWPDYNGEPIVRGTAD